MTDGCAISSVIIMVVDPLPLVSHHSGTFLGGQWEPSNGEHLLTVVNPSTGMRIATIRESSEDDVHRAVASARAALPGLRDLGATERTQLLVALAEELSKRKVALAEAVTREMGMPAAHCIEHQVEPAIEVVRATAQALSDVPFRERFDHSVVQREPIGVVGVVAPWSYPALHAMTKIAAAIAAGCSVVFKPSKYAPLDALVIAEAVSAAGIPAGAVNLVFGTGPHIGEALVRHPQVSMVSITGSQRVGRRVLHVAAANLKPVSLEVGGKSSSVALEDADLPAFVSHAVRSVMINTGQTCNARTRVVVPFQRLTEVEELVKDAMSSYRIGLSHDPRTDVGPLANGDQHYRVTSQLDRAPLDGARLVYSTERDELPEHGYFVPAQAHMVIDTRIPLAQEEVFGPVLAILPYVNEHDALEIANGCSFGPEASVWSADEERAVEVAGKIHVGAVDVNGALTGQAALPAGDNRYVSDRDRKVQMILRCTMIKSIRT